MDLSIFLSTVTTDSGIVLAGVGNRLKGDDAAGPLIIDQIKPIFKNRAIDCGVTPENYLEVIVGQKPHTVIIIDAVQMGLGAGEFALHDCNSAIATNFSSHAMSLSMCSNYLFQRCGCKVFLLGIQPQDITLEAPVSNPVLQAIERIVEIIKIRGDNNA